MSRRRSPVSEEAGGAEEAQKPRPKGIKPVVARSTHQEQYLQAIENKVITIGYGPAGSGKTFLAVYEAVRHHWNKSSGMKRIIITRPAVEAGEKIGFLPGSLEEKVDPYMRPIYDSLYDIMGIELTKEKIERGYIEIAPIGFMRGRTFRNCFVIVDEAQNATLAQLKMVATRIGENCKMVINGDPSQSDLPRNTESGLKKLVEIAKDIEDVSVISFGKEDIVRSQVVVDLVSAFDAYDLAHPNGNVKA